jgi:hypothetical protein
MMLQAGSIIDNKQSFLEVYEGRGRLLIKKTAKPGGEKDVISQIRMLTALPDSLSPHYPQIVDWEVSNPPYWYSMYLCEYPTLRELLFFSDTSANVLQSKLNKVIQFLFYDHYRWKRQPAESGYFARAYLERMHKRISSLRKYDPILEQALAVQRLSFDTKQLIPPLEALEKIIASEHLAKALNPPILCSIHGQMEFDHILMNPYDETTDDFVLLDPRGVEELGDTSYDVGKLWQSSRTKIDMVEEEKFVLEYRLGQNELTFVKFHLLPSLRLAVSQSVFESARSQLEVIMKDTSDPHLLMRSDFAEAVHICSAVPYYYEGQNKLRRALACYLLGALAINQFVANYI